jgi:hypothetical protein
VCQCVRSRTCVAAEVLRGAFFELRNVQVAAVDEQIEGTGTCLCMCVCVCVCACVRVCVSVCARVRVLQQRSSQGAQGSIL